MRNARTSRVLERIDSIRTCAMPRSPSFHNMESKKRLEGRSDIRLSGQFDACKMLGLVWAVWFQDLLRRISEAEFLEDHG